MLSTFDRRALGRRTSRGTRMGAVAVLLLSVAACAAPARSPAAPVAPSPVAAAPSWLTASADAMRAALTGGPIAVDARGPDPSADLRATRDRVPAESLRNDAWIGVVVTVRTGTSFVQGTAWTRPRDRARRWSALRRGTVRTGPPGPPPPGPMGALAALTRDHLPSADPDWGLPLARVPDDVRDAVRELAGASCELPLFDRAWAWDASGRRDWVERCDEAASAPEEDTRARVLALRLVVEDSGEILAAAAPVLEGEPLVLGPAVVRRVDAAVDPAAPPIAAWAARLGVRECLPGPTDSDLLLLEALGSGSFRVRTISGERRDAPDEAALRRAFTSMRRNHPDAPIRVPLDGCRAEVGSADGQQRAWDGAEVAARIATEVTGEAVAPCCP